MIDELASVTEEVVAAEVLVAEAEEVPEVEDAVIDSMTGLEVTSADVADKEVDTLESVAVERTAVTVPVASTTKNIVEVTVTVAVAAAPTAPSVVAVATAVASESTSLVVAVVAVLVDTEAMPVEMVLAPVEAAALVLTLLATEEAEVEVGETLSVARIWRPTTTEEEVVGSDSETAAVELLGMSENKFCAAVVEVEAEVTVASTALSDKADAMDAIAADTAAVGKTPPAVTPGIFMITVVESEFAFAEVIASPIVEEPVGTALALMIGAVAETTIPVPRATDAAVDSASVSEAVELSLVDESEQSSSSSPSSLDSVAVAVVELVLFSPAPAPSIPPLTLASSILATTLASVSQANEVPLLLTSGSAKHDNPCAHGVRVNVEPVHWAKEPSTQASSPAVIKIRFM